MHFLLEAATTTPEGGLSPLLVYGLMIVVVIAVFFFSSRSQRKQEKETQTMRSNLKVGDEITTIGGIIGKIISIKEDTVMIETGHDRMKIRIHTWAVKNVDVKADEADG